VTNAHTLPADLRDELARATGPALLLTRNNLALARDLAAAGPGLAWRVLTKDDLRGRGPRHLLGRLREAPWSVLVFEDDALEIRRRNGLHRALLAAARGRSRWLVASERERGIEVRRVRPLPAGLAALGDAAADITASAGAVLSGWGLERSLRGAAPRPDPRPGPNVAVLRTDFWFGVTAGGSVSHAVGVLEAMHALGLTPRLWTSSLLPVPPGVTQREVRPAVRPAWIEEAALAGWNRRFVEETAAEIAAFHPSVVYQRHSILSVAGLVLARRLGVPLVLEVNASEVWARKAWSRLQLERLAVDMEKTAFRGADRLVLVSEELVPTVLELGGDRDRVVVNPNGVDLRRFPPEETGRGARAELGIPPDAPVLGFLGTFARWHGVLFLAGEIPLLAARHPELHVVLIGDGDHRPEVEARLAESAAASRVHFTGLVSRDRVPALLAACDVLLSPHLPFSDGTPFFGSPTKLFEYLAAGRPVVASNLGQIGRVVADGETGILYPPGDGAAFREAVSRLVADPDLRRRLGRRARETAETSYTWEANVRRALSGFVTLPGTGAPTR
jgi:glycosyltransferase involved in cell wall biosynthesis